MHGILVFRTAHGAGATTYRSAVFISRAIALPCNLRKLTLVSVINYHVEVHIKEVITAGRAVMVLTPTAWLIFPEPLHFHPQRYIYSLRFINVHLQSTDHELIPARNARPAAMHGSANGSNVVRFQVLTAASMKFRIVFWDVLPCKLIVDRRFRGTYCLHHQGCIDSRLLISPLISYVPTGPK
jgi:hypothetical protein